MNKGKKFDKDKPRLDLIPPHGMLQVGEVMTYGATKYEAENWKLFKEEQDSEKRFLAAGLRHINAIMRGEDVDPESGLSHAAHAATNLLIYIDLQQMKQQYEQ